MLNKITILITFILFSAVTYSTEVISFNAKIKVDLNEVIETGTVTPVNGISAAGQPNENAFKVFAKEGYTTVIDLRTSSEDRGLNEPKVVSDLGMNYVSLPIGNDGLTFENAKILNKYLEQASGPVLLHCGSSNRVGAMLALSKKLSGIDMNNALSIGRSAGLTSLENAVIKVLKSNKFKED